MSEGAALSSTPTDAPDWSTVHREILCPLCDYNLRGLVEPRCPECGHRSEWSLLLDPDGGLHPWLFEHRRRKRVRSLLRTFFTSQLPRKFWAAVRPTHVPNERKLVAYWLLALTLLLGPVLMIVGLSVGNVYWNAYATRQRVRTFVTQNPNVQLRAAVQAAGGVNAYTDRTAPYPPLRDTLLGRTPFGIVDFHPEILGPVLVASLAWPWLTALTMTIFRQTMRRARIHPVHILRCAIYSADACVSLAVIVVPILWMYAPSPYDWSWSKYGARLFVPAMMVPLMICELILMYRLLVAYTRYLVLPQAVATVLASQMIVVLFLVTIYAFLAPL